jgi:hypothetical protein
VSAVLGLHRASRASQPASASGTSAGRTWLWLAVPCAVALAAWRLSLRHVDVAHLGSYGLTPALGAGWYVALALLLAGAVASCLHPRSRPAVMVLYLAALALVLYGTVPALSAQPHYAWVYKHIGVVRYLEAHGWADPSIDIYNRWPGFFATAAVFTRLAGRGDPASYVSWAELLFILLDAILVMWVVRAIAASTRIAAGAAMLFLLANWVGQTYYSPQAFSFLLALGLTGIMLRHLPGMRGEPKRLRALAEWAGRSPQQPRRLANTVRWPRPVAITAVLSLDAVIVASHQLTPYMLLISTVLLMASGVVRPWWLLGVMAAMTLAYLAANFTFIQHNYGFFTSIDPFNNIRVAAYSQTPSPGKAVNTDAELLSIAAMGLGTLWASARLLRRGLLIRALPLVALALSPAGVVFGQNYGGEASLRVVLFASPWASALIAWAIGTLRGPTVRYLIAGVTAFTFAALFVPAFFGAEELNIISGGERRASEHFYYHARPGSVLVLAAPGFPFKYGGTYPQFRGPEGDAYPNLLSERVFQSRRLGAAEIPAVIARIELYARHGYVAFTKGESAFAEVLRITPPGALGELQAALARSPRFRLWYANRDAQIYELLAEPTQTAASAPVRASGHEQSAQRASRRTARGKPHDGRGRAHRHPRRRALAAPRAIATNERVAGQRRKGTSQERRRPIGVRRAQAGGAHGLKAP